MNKLFLSVASLMFLVTLAGSGFALSRASSPASMNPAKNINVASAQPSLSFSMPSPSGGTSIESIRCSNAANVHEPSSCDVILKKDGESQAMWSVDDVVFGAWSADGSTVVLEDRENRIHVGSIDRALETIPGNYSTPSLSPNGDRIVAHELGTEGDILQRIEESPGIVLIDLASGEGRILLSDDVYMPFFIDENRIGYGSGGDDQIASLYLYDIRSETSVKLTNRDDDPSNRYPMPVAPPILSEDGETLLYSGVENGKSVVYGISLSDYVLRVIPNASAPLISGHQPVLKSATK